MIRLWRWLFHRNTGKTPIYPQWVITIGHFELPPE